MDTKPEMDFEEIELINNYFLARQGANGQPVKPQDILAAAELMGVDNKKVFFETISRIENELWNESTK